MAEHEHRTFQLPGAGLKCGACQTVLPTVARTVQSPGFVRRERVCPKCGLLNETTERVIQTREKRRYFNQPCGE